LQNAAFDRKLISVGDQYRIEVSSFNVSRLTNSRLVLGLKQFQQHLRAAIVIPADHAIIQQQYILKMLAGFIVEGGL
jgi:predicted restriction endonuclease